MTAPTFTRPSASRSSSSQALAAISDILDSILNRVFALNHDAARTRSMVIWVAFIVIWILLAFTAYPKEQYTAYANQTVILLAQGDPVLFVEYVVKALAAIFLNPVVMRHLLAMYMPYWLMQQVAAVYLADIFEKDEKVASTFIRQAAFAGTYNTIHIRQGKVAEEDKLSPMIQIGGPGYVVVELDSAVVLEKPDGSARVIGPTIHERHKEQFVSGFERVRQGLDLRDIIQKQEITTRSRDGIPVTARDVQYSFSIYRGHRAVKTPQSPYPFDANAALNLVYGAGRSVKLGEPPARMQDWSDPLPGKTLGPVGGEMGGFINSRGLSEFLAAVGKLENDSLTERKKESDERIRALAGIEAGPENQTAGQFAGNLDVQAPGDNLEGQTIMRPAGPSGAAFVSRSNLTNMFYDSFQSKAAQRGTQLNWIGVGTWDTPAQIIPKNHLEAWKLSRENFARGNPGELQRIRNDARMREIIRLTEEIAIRKLYNEYELGKPDEQVITSILKEYLTVLDSARELYRRINIPDDILRAIQEIERWIYPPSHSVGEE